MDIALPRKASVARTARTRWSRLALYAFVLISHGLLFFPILWMTVSAFKPLSEVLRLPPTLLPEQPTLSNFEQLFVRTSFPVYFVLTKMDLVAGFTEFFGDLTPEQRAMVWGMTFKPKNRAENMVGAFAQEFDDLMMALSDQTTDRLQMEPDARARSRIFGFPMQMASLKQPLNDFLVKVFEPSRYQSETALRGVYFTSGTQEGTPIDRVLGALRQTLEW